MKIQPVAFTAHATAGQSTGRAPPADDLVLYELAGVEGRVFSPFCWRARLALAHKGLAFTCQPTVYAEIAGIGDGTHKTVPVLQHGTTFVHDSAAIADYLETNWPDRPSLFGGIAGRALTDFVKAWTESVQPRLMQMICVDIHDHLDPGDRDYFRETRQHRLGKALEDCQGARDGNIEAYRQALQPLRAVLGAHSFIGGEAPLYADYIVLAMFMWARSVSPFQVLADDDPIRGWIGRCRGLMGEVMDGTVGYDETLR